MELNVFIENHELRIRKTANKALASLIFLTRKGVLFNYKFYVARTNAQDFQIKRN